jgi:hypothetical protein
MLCTFFSITGVHVSIWTIENGLLLEQPTAGPTNDVEE